MKSNTARIRDGIRDDTVDTRMIVDLCDDLDEAVAEVERLNRVRQHLEGYDSSGLLARAEKAEAALAEYKEDLRRWHTRAAIAEAAAARYHDEGTMQKVWDALRRAGLDDTAILDCVNDMQNAGLYFREKA